MGHLAGLSLHVSVHLEICLFLLVPWHQAARDCCRASYRPVLSLLLPSGTEEADGSTDPALLFLCGGVSRAGGGNAHHSNTDNKGAAEDQRHHRTLQGPGSHAAKVRWHGLECRAPVFQILNLKHQPSRKWACKGGVGFGACGLDLVWFTCTGFIVTERFNSASFYGRFLSP